MQIVTPDKVVSPGWPIPGKPLLFPWLAGMLNSTMTSGPVCVSAAVRLLIGIYGQLFYAFMLCLCQNFRINPAPKNFTNFIPKKRPGAKGALFSEFIFIYVIRHIHIYTFIIT